MSWWCKVKGSEVQGISAGQAENLTRALSKGAVDNFTITAGSPRSKDDSAALWAGRTLELRHGASANLG